MDTRKSPENCYSLARDDEQKKMYNKNKKFPHKFICIERVHGAATKLKFIVAHSPREKNARKTEE